MFVRYLRNNGRLSIPHEILERFQIAHGTFMILGQQESYIVMEKVYFGCIFCGAIERVKLHRKIPYCTACAAILNAQIEETTREK